MTLQTHWFGVSLANTATEWQGDTIAMPIFRAPPTLQGGGVTIIDAFYWDAAAGGAGTAFSLSLLNYGTAGTASAGTVAAPIGGTADPFAAGVPKQFVISNGFIAAGEYVFLYKDETNSSDPARGFVGGHYQMGE